MEKLDRDGRDELHYAARDGDLEKIKGRLRAGVDVDLAENRSQYTPLHSAVDSGRFQATEKLLDSGANIHARTKLKHTPLHMAVARWRQCPDGSLIKLLIDRGADVSATEGRGRTPADVAAGQFEFPDELNRMLTHE